MCGVALGEAVVGSQSSVVGQTGTHAARFWHACRMCHSEPDFGGSGNETLDDADESGEESLRPLVLLGDQTHLSGLPFTKALEIPRLP